MSLTEDANAEIGVARSIVHATDFSSQSQVAFHHALGLAVAARSRLTLVHVDNRSDVHWLDYPGIRDTLCRWGLLPPDASKKAIRDLGIRASKVHVEGRDPVKGVVERAVKVHADLLVLGTQRRQGLWRWLRPSVADSIARRARCPCLLLPPATRGFVDRRDGSARLGRVLVPIAKTPSPWGALHMAERMLDLLAPDGGVLHVLHVGEAASSPTLDLPTSSELRKVIVENREGDVVSTILDAASEADMVVMASLGRDSATDTLFGSTTERVLAGLNKPLLMLPEES